MPQPASSFGGTIVLSPSLPGSHSLMGKFTTFDENIEQSYSLIIKELASGTVPQSLLLPCGRHSVFVQCRLRPIRQWFARVRSPHSGECIAPLVVPLEEV